MLNLKHSSSNIPRDARIKGKRPYCEIRAFWVSLRASAIWLMFVLALRLISTDPARFFNADGASHRTLALPSTFIEPTQQRHSHNGQQQRNRTFFDNYENKDHAAAIHYFSSDPPPILILSTSTFSLKSSPPLFSPNFPPHVNQCDHFVNRSARTCLYYLCSDSTTNCSGVENQITTPIQPPPPSFSLFLSLSFTAHCRGAVGAPVGVSTCPPPHVLRVQTACCGRQHAIEGTRAETVSALVDSVSFSISSTTVSREELQSSSQVPPPSRASTLFGITLADAYIIRRRISTTSVANLRARIGQEETLPRFNARPFENGLFQWSIVREDGNEYLQGNFSYTGDYYAAVGISSPKRMQGPMIVCYVNSTIQADSYATCLDFHGGNFDIQRAPTYTTMMDASVTPVGGVSLTFRRLLRRNNASTEDLKNLSLDDPVLDDEPRAEGQIDYDVNNPVELNKAVRVIFAKGKFLDNARRPKQHQADDVRVVTINWATGEVLQLKSIRHVYVLGAAAGVLGVLIIGGFTIHRFPSVLPTWSRFVGMALISTIFIVFCVSYSFANYLDYKDTVTGKAHVRSLGDGAAFAFVCMMICVSRRLVMETCFGISPERAVVYHGLCCAVFFIVATAHAIGMLYFYGLEWSVRWRDKDHVSKLPGVIGYLLCFPVIVFGMLRNSGSAMWTLYKYSHTLHIPIVFMLCCHYTKLVYGLIAPAVLILFDVVLERFATPFEAEADVVAVVDALSQCTILRVYTARYVGPGQWYRVQIPSISRDYHPLFVAIPLFYDNDDPYFEFIIKNTCDVTDRGWSRTGNRAVLEQIKAGKSGHLPHRPSSWTSKLYHAVLENKTPIEHVRLRGPCGSPVVNAVYGENILFVAGGVGIAPILSQLTALTCGFNPHSIEVGRQHVVCLLWVIPNAGLLNIYGHALAQCKMYLKLINRQMAVSMKIYVTDSRTPPSAREELSGRGGSRAGDDKVAPSSAGGSFSSPIVLLPEVLTELCVIRGRRPDVAQDIASVQQLVDANASWSTLEDGRIEASSDRCAVYMCGPDSLIESVSRELRQRNTKATKANKARDPTKQRLMTEFVIGTETFTL